MDREIGNVDSMIWLLGDSEPKNWRDKLRSPLDSRHPIRHNIWTSIVDVFQDELYRSLGKCLETRNLFIRNAIGDPASKPSVKSIEWNKEVKDEMDNFSKLIVENHPIVIFCFGSFAFEFCRRANVEEIPRNYGSWGAHELGEEFRKRYKSFDADRTNILPLLHRSIAGKYFLENHKAFCGENDSDYSSTLGELSGNY